MNSVSHLFKSSHYGLSTAVAVLYVIGWLVATPVHAENNPSFALPAVVVTASRAQSTLDAVVVTASRDQNDSEKHYAMLEPVMVLANRNAMMIASAVSSPSVSTNGIAISRKTEPPVNRQSLVARVSHWFASR